MRAILLGLVVASSVGCSGGGPAPTDTSSASLPTLESKVEFLRQYVKFRRGYEALEFHVVYRNGGSVLPSPSEWDVRLVARVPPGELDQWIPAGVKPAPTADTSWLASVPQSAKASGITEWYVEPRRMVGIDRMQAVVAYRSWAY